MANFICCFLLIIGGITGTGATIREITRINNDSEARRALVQFLRTNATCLQEKDCVVDVPPDQDGYRFALTRSDTGFDLTVVPDTKSIVPGHYAYYADERVYKQLLPIRYKEGLVAPGRELTDGDPIEKLRAWEY